MAIGTFNANLVRRARAMPPIESHHFPLTHVSFSWFPGSGVPPPRGEPGPRRGLYMSAALPGGSRINLADVVVDPTTRTITVTADAIGYGDPGELSQEKVFIAGNGSSRPQTWTVIVKSPGGGIITQARVSMGGPFPP